MPKIKIIRKQQLEKQEQIDDELKNINNTCPDIVSKYLIMQRYLSRIQQQEMIKSNIIDLIPTVNKHFDENTKIYNEFFEILNCDNRCECLKKIILFHN